MVMSAFAKVTHMKSNVHDWLHLIFAFLPENFIMPFYSRGRIMISVIFCFVIFLLLFFIFNCLNGKNSGLFNSGNTPLPFREGHSRKNRDNKINDVLNGSDILFMCSKDQKLLLADINEHFS